MSRPIRCEGCGWNAKPVDEMVAQRLDALEHRDDEEDHPARVAYECKHCEAVIFEDEFTDGKFVPPQYARYLELSGNSHDLGGSNDEQLVTLPTRYLKSDP